MLPPQAPYGITTTEGTEMFAFNGGGSTPNAVVETSVISGQTGADTYVYFDYGNYGANQLQQLLFEVVDADDDSVIFSQQLADGLGTNTVALFSPFFLNFTSTTDDFYLRFTDNGANVVGSSDGLLDNIRVSQLQVPEPTSIAIWSLIGLIMTGVCWRRRSRQ